MKQKGLIISLIIGIGFLFVSCDQFYFSTPQPIDAKNIYEFPKEFRGVWSDNLDSIIIGKDYYLNIENRKVNVSKKEVDTSSSYIIYENKIYKIDKEDEMLNEGYHYSIENDIITYLKREVSEIELGRKAFLRKLGNKYVVNIKNENQWWNIYLIEKTKDGGILLKILNNYNLEKIEDVKYIYSSDHNFYLNVNWTKDELLKLINKGAFSDTVMILEKDCSIKN
jgi:metal-sulfur cluster biosynthetic enzyme